MNVERPACAKPLRRRRVSDEQDIIFLFFVHCSWSIVHCIAGFVSVTYTRNLGKDEGLINSPIGNR
jgi:hypothetical protein